MAAGYAINWPSKDGIDIRTVSSTRRGALMLGYDTPIVDWYRPAR